MHHSEIKAPFGDGEHTFALPWKQLVELEEAINGSGFRLLNDMINRRHVATKPMREIVRLGLIGGGMPPVQALKLVERYVEDRPLMESFDLACQILEAGYFGSPKWQASPERAAARAGIDPDIVAAADALKAATLGADA